MKIYVIYCLTIVSLYYSLVLAILLLLIETYKRLIVNVYPELWERTLKGTAQDSLVVCG